MKKTLPLAAAALGLAAALAAPTAAFAQEASSLNVSASNGITSVDAAVLAGDHSGVSIKILQVTKSSSRVWQRCNFNYSGAGSYRCGFDSQTGSLAQAQDGRWVAKAFIDGQLIARQAFTL